jgi:hypothetical protein
MFFCVQNYYEILQNNHHLSADNGLGNGNACGSPSFAITSIALPPIRIKPQEKHPIAPFKLG